MCRLAAAHKTIRLMLLGLPPDMVHGVSLHRARTSIFRNFLLKLIFEQTYALYNIITQITKFVKHYFQQLRSKKEKTDTTREGGCRIRKKCFIALFFHLMFRLYHDG